MISVVIPSYNRRDCMLALLRDLRLQSSTDFEVIVVDDGSTDGTVPSIRERHPEVVLIENSRNGGPAVSRNRGIQSAKGDIIVGFDSDVTLPDRLLLIKVHALFATTAATGLAFRIKAPDGQSEDVARWWHPLPIETHAGKSFLTPYFSGTAYAFRKEPLLQAGLFPEILYMHFEEVELAWRILDQGGAIRYSPELQVVHHANVVSRRSEVEVFYKPRNQILLAASCLPFYEAMAYVAPRSTYQLLKACSHGHLKDFLASMGSAARLLPRQLSTREPLKKSTVRSIKINSMFNSLKSARFRKPQS